MASNGFEEIIPDCQSLVPNLRALDLPFPRSGHRLVANDRYAIAIGGFNPSLWNELNTEQTYFPILKEVWMFNLLTRRWRKLTTEGNMPKELASHAALLHDNFVLVYGGTGVPFGHSSTNELHALDMKKATWRLLPVSPVDPISRTPLPRQYGHAFVRRGNQLYIIGGTSGFQYNMEVYGCTLNDTGIVPIGEWKYLLRGPEAEPRYRHEAFYFNGKLHVLGGGTAISVCPLDTIDVFDIESGTWTVKPIQADSTKGVPLPRRCHGLTVIESSAAAGQHISVYICGGYNGEIAFDDVWELKVTLVNSETKFAWCHCGLKLPRPLYFHGMACTPNGNLLVFGGVDGITGERSAKMYRCSLNAPSLREIALRTIFIALGQPDERKLKKMAVQLQLSETDTDWLVGRW